MCKNYNGWFDYRRRLFSKISQHFKKLNAKLYGFSFMSLFLRNCIAGTTNESIVY